MTASTQSDDVRLSAGPATEKPPVLEISPFLFVDGGTHGVGFTQARFNPRRQLDSMST
jgi:hypothetical protein